MKKLLTLVALCTTVFATSQAQSFVSGAFNYSRNTGDDTYADDSRNNLSNRGSSFGITPRYGYNLNEKWAIGIGIDYYTASYEYSNTSYTNETNRTMTTFAPFARYTFATVGKFKFLAEGVIGYGIGSTERKTSLATDNYDDSKFSIRVAPVVQFAFNDKWSLESTINVVSLGYTSEKSSGDGYESTDNNFNLGAGTNVGLISIGALYNF